MGMRACLASWLAFHAPFAGMLTPTRPDILNSFLTAATSVKGTGVAIKLWGDLFERCRDQGYNGTISFCVEGDGMSHMMPLFSRLLKLNTERIFSVEFLVRPLRPAPSERPLRSLIRSPIGTPIGT
jgi:hypothetical protein